ncbi:hypothetical protein ACFX13_017742 [Malus domestica]
MDVGRRKSGVVAGSVWESRMKVDQVKGGVKVFNGDQDNAEETSTNGVTAATRARLKRAPAGGGGAASSGKRKTWKSETFEGSEKSPIQISKGKTESVKNSDEQCKELSVSVDGIRKSPAQLRRLRSEGTKEIGVSAEKNERSPIGIRKPRRELLKSSSDLGEGAERNSIQLRKVKSESSRGIDDPSGSAIQSEKPKSEPNKASDESDKEMESVESESSRGIDDASGSAIQSEKAKLEPNKASDETDKEIESVDVSVKEIEENPVENSEIGDDGSDENCKEFGVCEEMVVKSSGGSNAGVLKSDDDRKAKEDNDGDDGGDESEEEVDEEIEVEIEKKSVDIKEVNAAPEEKPTAKIVKEEAKVVKVNEVKKPAGPVRTGSGPALLQLERREVKKLLQKPPESISLNLKKSPAPVIKRATVFPKVPKYNYTSFSASKERHSSFPETHSRLQSLVDLIMWKDISRSVFVFGIGTFVILSSSYTKDINISFISVISYLGLLYLAAIFLFKSIICRGVLEVDNTNYVVGEQEAIWLLRLVLPYLNEFLLKLKALFSGDPATTIKLAVLLFVLARCGSSITIWTMCKVGFFGVFTLPKLCSLYSAQITVYAKFWVRRFRDAWESCTHKKPLTIAIFLLVWNLSSVVARIWAAFILLVAFRYYQQKLVAEEWAEESDDAAAGGGGGGAQETWEQEGGQRQGHVDITKEKKGF